MSTVRGGTIGAEPVIPGGRILMYIRCAHCQHSTRVPPSRVGLDVTCESCGQTHSLERARALGATAEERHERIVAYSDAHCVDLASACSILLGILPPEDAILIRDSTEGRTEKPPKYDAALDPGFARAIAEGFISRPEALRRGNRRAYASGIAQRHKLSIPVALLVADNRMSLERALSRKEAATSNGVPTEVATRVIDVAPEPTFWRWLFLALVVVAGSFGAMTYLRGRAEQHGDTRQVVDSIETRRDAISLTSVEPVARKNPTDAVVRISAAHPRDVLVAFCKSSRQANPRTPLRIEPSADGWIGFYEDAGRTFRIFIQRDRHDARLFTSDGRQPIELAPAATVAAKRPQ
jgi:hypothetical protein